MEKHDEARELDAILERLRASTGAGRCTLRIDDEARGWSVQLICAEATGPGVKSLRGEGGINQRASPTVKWMEAHRRNLLQDDLLHDPDPCPPAALMSAYAAKAQMLSPLFDGKGALAGWISAHFTDAPRRISATDEAALDQARREVLALLRLDA